MSHTPHLQSAGARVAGSSATATTATAILISIIAQVSFAKAAPLNSLQSAAGQPTPIAITATRDLHDLLLPIRDKTSIPALAGVAIKDGQIIAQGYAGVRAVNAPDEITINDKFHLGSCTKAMTATMIARLVDRGVMRWDMSIGDVFADRPAIHEKFRPARLDQLLTNRAGFPRETSNELWAKLWARKGTPTAQRLQLLDGSCSVAPEYEPGAKFVYSNTNFSVAGAMAEKVTGKAWEDLMREELFMPLGITSAGFGAPGSAGEVDQPRGHVGKPGALKPAVSGPSADNPPAIGPAGTVHMSLPDWARFVALHARADHALLDDKPADDPAFALVSKASMAKLHQAIDGEGAGVKNSDTSGYAMGWGVASRPWAGGRVLTHSGSNTMWYCVVWIAPKKDFAVLVATNAGLDAAGATDQAAAAIIGEFLKP